ncbi:hypothetical protein PN294_14520 [Romboutsia sp. 1001216sp1]|uniref:hypothetical protein n=1 Tax=unclassified Romboutsia TaxID=2626894 RepID=UPI00189C77F3|nr:MULTISPECIES: hypothetical protein [unclassified Romboutsia]MDB8803394.1 hypothetical protein [Romboutsia sp. 1001216sp1]MDB8814791.1 hypothetical protein [Romboutsia sp. 1001216sp1]
MSGKYVNNGQVGAMGDYASASNFTFGTQVNDSFKLTKNDLDTLNKLVENLAGYNGKEAKKSEIMNASIIIQELAESVEEDNINEQNKSISKWKSFINDATPAAIDVINVVSSGISMAEQVKTFLGL